MQSNEGFEGLKYVIADDGFEYDLQRGVLVKGSTVSRTAHQLSDVESLKSELIADGSIVRDGNRYVCMRDIPTGLMMAYNLHCKQLEPELPDLPVAFAPGSEELVPVNEALQLWATYAPDKAFVSRIEKDSFRVTKLIRADYDWSFVNGKGDGSLSKVEQFVVDALIAAGEIDEFRRGDPAYRECDIVDDKRMRQIEFVSLFDEKIPPRFRYRNEMNEEQSIVLEYSDLGYNLVADGVINKFTMKNYTDKYSKELAIYMIGCEEEAADKVEALKSILEAREGEIRNQYARIHIILHDPLENESFVYCSNDKYVTYPDSLCSVNIVERGPADPDNIEADKSYLMIRESIFAQDLWEMIWAKGSDILMYLGRDE